MDRDKFLDEFFSAGKKQIMSKFHIANGLDEFFSIMNRNGDIHLFVDKYGDPTTSYPHVHVVHKGGGKVDVVASHSDGRHTWKTTLQNPSGNEVNEAIQTATSYL